MPTSTKSAKKPLVSKKIKKAARKNVSASSAKVLATQANAEKTAQPGIIAHLMGALVTAKEKKVMMTVDEIVQQLVKKFPDREATGMQTTVRAQLSRLPKEKDFAINKQRDGRVVRYAAA